ncbi:MAG: hypothetical protein K6B52_04965 [Clostridiales bacterium]|nr:hypothetical protein [Clostridiales bacterium]
MNKHTKKTFNPSERESVTPYSEYYGGKADFEHRQKKRKRIRTVSYIILIILLVYAGYFFADTLIKITELPV